MTGNNSEGAPGSNTKATNAQQPGEGIRNLKTSNVFRAVNFELYAKPVLLHHFPTCLLELIKTVLHFSSFQNKFVMAVGLTAFVGCVGYIAYMKHQWKEAKVVTALNDNDELILVKKKSQWD